MAVTAIKVPAFHIFGAIGGGAKGFKKSQARLGQMRAEFETLGSVDVDAAACRNFERIVGVPATCIDLFSREQYRAFHGREPGPDWREAVPDDIRRAAQYRSPWVAFLSAPCKGFSGLLSETKSQSAKYQALNGLTVRGVLLFLEAFKDDPALFILFENVPRIRTRGRKLLDQIVALLQAYGYATAETEHDCGELGGLAQSRKRFLLVARYMPKVPNFLYEPPKRRLRAVGEILEKLPLPGDPAGGPMHRMPALQWKTWVRLAFVEAGRDWRSLARLRVKDGVLQDYALLPDRDYHRSVLGVTPWDGQSATVTSNSRPGAGKFSVADPRAENFKGAYGVCRADEAAGTIGGQSLPSNGRFSVADPRIDGHHKSVQHGVLRMRDTAGVVTGKMFVGGGNHAVADPRIPEQAGRRFNNVYRVVRMSDTGPSVTGGTGPTAGGVAVADPRGPQRDDYKSTKYRVTRMGEAAGAVIAASTTGNGAFAVADPRPGYGPSTHHNVLHVADTKRHAKTISGSNHPSGGALSVADPRLGMDPDRQSYRTNGQYGVQPWDGTSYAVSGAAQHDSGPWNVADPRLPEPNDRLVALIIAEDQTWHRPFTTLELAALQSFVDPEEEMFRLDSTSDSQCREWIGNAVPPDAAEAMGSTILRAVLSALTGETFMLSSEPIWVRPVAVALQVARVWP